MVKSDTRKSEKWKCQKDDCSYPESVDPIGHIFEVHLKLPVIRCPYCNECYSYYNVEPVLHHVKETHIGYVPDVVDKRMDYKKDFDKRWDQSYPDFDPPAKIKLYTKDKTTNKNTKKRKRCDEVNEDKKTDFPSLNRANELDDRWLTENQRLLLRQRMKQEAERALNSGQQLDDYVCGRCYNWNKIEEKQRNPVAHVFEVHLRLPLLMCFYCTDFSGLSYYNCKTIERHIEECHPNKTINIIDRRRKKRPEFIKEFALCFPELEPPKHLPKFKLDYEKEIERAKTRIKEEVKEGLYDWYHLGDDSDVEEMPIKPKIVPLIDFTRNYAEEDEESKTSETKKMFVEKRTERKKLEKERIKQKRTVIDEKVVKPHKNEHYSHTLYGFLQRKAALKAADAIRVSAKSVDDSSSSEDEKNNSI